jgi:hypothetical protein
MCSLITSGSIYHGYSEGGGYFSTTSPRPSRCAAFVVSKDRFQCIVRVRIRSPELKWFIEKATGISTAGILQEEFNLNSISGILQDYWRFKLLFWQLDHNVECARFMPLIRLFIQGFLVEKRIWESFDLPRCYQEGRLVGSHWQEMEGISIGRDIDDCERLFKTKDTLDLVGRGSTTITDYKYTVPDFDLTDYKYTLPDFDLPVYNHTFPVDSLIRPENYTIQESNTLQAYCESNLESMNAASAVGHLSALSDLLTQPVLKGLIPIFTNLLSPRCPTPILRGRWSLGYQLHVCPPKVLDDLYSTAAKNGRVEVIKWLMNMFCVPPSRFVADIAAYFGQQKVLDCLAAIGVYGTRGCQPRRELQQRLKTRGRWEQRRAIQEILRKAFHAEHEAFLDKSIAGNASDSLSNFAKSLFEPEKVWRKGIQTIRNILDNQIPSDLQDIFGCVQVSRAMRSSLAENVDDYDGADTSQIYPDLVRWRCAVAEIDHELFDEIAASIWGQNLSQGILQDNGRLCDEILLEHFRAYFENLIAATRAACVFSGDEIHSSDTRRLCDIQDDFVIVSDESGSGSPEPASTAQNPDTSTPEFIAQPQHKDHEIIAQPMIILLTATTIFMIIVAFFIGMLHDMDSRSYGRIANNVSSSSASIN